MAKPRTFTTLPARAIGDTRPTALDLRCLAVIALHDGMSKVSGKGGGCYARNATLAALARTDASNFSKSLSRLIAWGYVAREPQLMDKRKFTLRVIYGDDDSWRTDQQSPAEIVGIEPGSPAEIVGEADHENGGISKETGEHYISLKEELDFSEKREINSSEEAETSFSASAFGVDLAIERQGKKSGKAGLGSEWSFAASLPHNFARLPAGAQLARFEEAFAGIGRDPERIASREREAFANWLNETAEAFWDQPHGQQAQRLLEEINAW